MLWFFVVPALVFMGWASYSLISGALHPKPRDVFTKLQEISNAKTTGDRWQAAYGLAQGLQQMIRDGEIKKLPAEKRAELFGELDHLLEVHSTDSRLKRYLLLTMGQMGEAAALPALERGFGDKDPEVKFFSSWGYIDLLDKNPSEKTPARLQKISVWLTDEDPALRKVASTFLAQQGGEYPHAVQALLNDKNVEVRWNAAVALASIGDKSATPVLMEMFDLQKLRLVEFKNSKDLATLLATAKRAATKLGDAEVLDQIQKLKSSATASTPEGRAILGGLSL